MKFIRETFDYGTISVLTLDVGRGKFRFRNYTRLVDGDEEWMAKLRLIASIFKIST